MGKSNSVRIERPMINSPALMKLTGVAPQVLLLFLARRKFSMAGRRGGKKSWIFTNNGDIEFPYSQAEKQFGITKPRFNRALKQLVEVGFIDINHHGGGMVKDSTTYFISERWVKFGKKGFVKKSLPKDTRKLGITPDNWEERTGKKRSSKSKIANENVTGSSKENITCDEKRVALSGNKNITGGTSIKTNQIKNKMGFSNSTHSQ